MLLELRLVALLLGTSLLLLLLLYEANEDSVLLFGLVAVAINLRLSANFLEFFEILEFRGSKRQFFETRIPQMALFEIFELN